MAEGEDFFERGTANDDRIDRRQERCETATSLRREEGVGFVEPIEITIRACDVANQAHSDENRSL